MNVAKLQKKQQQLQAQIEKFENLHCVVKKREGLKGLQLQLQRVEKQLNYKKKLGLPV
jgi:hypothetical protein